MCNGNSRCEPACFQNCLPSIDLNYLQLFFTYPLQVRFVTSLTNYNLRTFLVIVIWEWLCVGNCHYITWLIQTKNETLCVTLLWEHKKCCCGVIDKWAQMCGWLQEMAELFDKIFLFSIVNNMLQHWWWNDNLSIFFAALIVASLICFYQWSIFFWKAHTNIAAMFHASYLENSHNTTFFSYKKYQKWMA